MLVKNNGDLFELLDSFLKEPTEFWDTFYSIKSN